MGVAKKIIDKKVLRDLVPINALSAIHLEEISRKAVIADVRAGRYVFKQGDRDYQSVYLLEGKVELIANKGEVVGQVKAGSEAARHPLAHKQPRQLSVRAVGNVTIACVDSSLLDVLLTWDESAGYDVVEIDAQDDDDWMTRMLQSQAFLQLPPSNIHQLLMRLEAVSARAGEVIVRQGDEGDYFYIVKTGRLAVTRKASPRGKEVALAELGEGACFGEEALVSDTRRNASVTMITDGDLMRLSKQDFQELLCTPLVHEIAIAEARELVSSGAQWLDVRLPGEFENHAIRGSRNLPLSALREESAELDSDATYILCCDTGRRSAAGAFVLGQRGLKVYTLKKGLMDVPEEMLTAIPGAESKNAGQHDRGAEIIPFEAEDRECATAPDRAGQADMEPSPPGPGAAKGADTGRVDRQSLEQQLREAQARLAQADAQLGEERAISERVMLQVESLERELQQLASERQSLEDRLRSAESGKSRSGELETAVARLEKQQQEHEKRSHQLEQDLARVRDDYRQLGQRASALGGERDAAVRDLEKARTEIQSLKQQLTSRQGETSDQIETLENLLEQRGKELDEEKSQRRYLEQQLDERAGAHQALENELEKLRQQAQDQASGHQALVSELDATRVRAEELQTLLTGAGEREQDFLVQIGNLEKAADAAMAQLRDETTAEQQGLEKRLSEMEAELDAKARMLEDAGVSYQELEQKSAAMQQELEAAREDAQTSLLEARRAADEAADQVRAEAAKEQERLNQQIVGLQSRLDEQAQLLNEEKNRHSDVQQKLSQLEQEREALAGSERATQETLRQMEQQLEESRRALEQAGQRASEYEQQLTESRQHGAASEKQIAELEKRLKDLHKSHESDLASVRGALARAQDERENVMRDQKRLMDALRKAEHALAQARQDHESEVYRLRKELKQGAGEENSGLAAELEALQEKIKEQAQQREELEVSLGSRSEQLENAQLEVQRLHQQLVQAQDSARQAEQQLVEANQAADQEMTVRLQAEQEARRKLGDELEKVTLERNEHQERLTVLVLEAEELRSALTAQEVAQAEAADGQRQLENLRAQLRRIEQERDGLRESELRLQQETDQLRAEAEVTRGLVNMAPAGDGDLAVREELVTVKKNVEIAVRLRSQAEARVVELERDVVRLEAELEQARGRCRDDGTPARIPSLDENDPQAAVVLNRETHDLDDEEDDVLPGTAVLLEEGNPGDSGARAEILPGASQSRARSGWKSMLAGLLVGGLTVGSGVWWIHEQRDSVTATSAVSADQPVAETDAVALPGMAAPDLSATTRDDASAVKSQPRIAAPVGWGLPAPEPAAQSSSANVAAERDTRAPMKETVAEDKDVSTGARAEIPHVAQPGSYFKDRLSSGDAGPAMVELNADRFMMGSGPASPNFDERPQREVQLKRFAISRYETTFDEYDRFALDTGRVRPNDMGWGRGKRPVVNVSWQDATAYAQWLSRQTGQRYRLPTEAEWEFAARAGSSKRFWWGNDVDSSRANCFDCGGREANRSTVAVGSFEASAYGVYDMAGNAREWVMDCYAPNYAEAREDGGAVEFAGCSDRVVRGGGFSSPSDKLRSSARDASAAHSRLNDLGFRVVRDY
ncbi:MAG: SUMF1/EgtB/PvdO family nonheme iron enzyme [Thiogranum sp.]|nr:SUMF1/EgtB/PvdO family nonheme iron enzyme [Thiogranum sp.]